MAVGVDDEARRLDPRALSLDRGDAETCLSAASTRATSSCIPNGFAR